MTEPLSEKRGPRADLETFLPQVCIDWHRLPIHSYQAPLYHEQARVPSAYEGPCDRPVPPGG